MLLYNIESLAKKLATDYKDVTQKVEHMGLRGAAREDVLKDVIRQLIPEKYRVGSGLIVDVDNTQSRQQDLFIFDAFNSPIFMRTESSSVIPVESVYATIEVKSTLTKTTLKQSIENIQSVKTLKHTELVNSASISSRHNTILGTVFAYTSDSSLEAIAHNVNEICTTIPISEQPNFICVFDKGLIVNVKKDNVHQVELDPSEKTMWGMINNDQEINLYFFYLLLQQHLSMAQNFPPDLMKYAAATHKLDDMKIVIPKDMIPDDMFLDIGNGLSGEDIKFFSDNYQIFYKLLSGNITDEEFMALGKNHDEIEEFTNRFVSIIKSIVGAEPVVAGGPEI